MGKFAKKNDYETIQIDHLYDENDSSPKGNKWLYPDMNKSYENKDVPELSKNV